MYGVRIFLALLASLAVAACAGRRATVSAPATASPYTTISIIATTDLHGQLKTLPWLGGHVKVLRDIRRADGGAVLLVDAGDMWQGTLASNLSEGSAVVRAYNVIGYDAVAIGNHEFDFGPRGPQPVPRRPEDNARGALEAGALEAKFPFLAANITGPDGRRWMPENVRPSIAVTRAGVKVGLIGVTTIRTPEATDPRNLLGLQFTPLAEAIIPEARRLRAEGAAVVIVLSHAGGSCKAWSDPSDVSSCSTASEVFTLASALPPGLVDVIAAGHSHLGVAHRVNGIAVVQAFADGRAFSRVDLQVDRTAGAVRDVRVHPPRFVCRAAFPEAAASQEPAAACAPEMYEGREVTRDVELDRAMRPDLERARATAERRLGVTLSRSYAYSSRVEAPADNLVVDLLRATTPGVDVAIYNGGGTRSKLDPGPLTYGAVYELVPFDSTLATARLTAGSLARAVARALTRNVLPTISGLSAVASCDGGTPRVALWRGHLELGPNEPLSVVTSEFLAAGGSAIFEGMTADFTITQGEPMREAIVRILPSMAGAIEAGTIGVVDKQRPRISLPGPLPLRCAP